MAENSNKKQDNNEAIKVLTQRDNDMQRRSLWRQARIQAQAIGCGRSPR